ncbi:hypothetical protein N0M98_10895 [Paenibacillus doosanensis]|uniref:Uncharacterized protein n=1 Tax=Paenibacillus konkukensis TaxID=2020716 RepID=A0ABY4RL72_9BACL|nr:MULTISPECIES: hypothetical protein [Paenibacillus]MCS7460649.1 hypothetical protein [Paenibacillus doosanensis]UQZ82630.1 hypothetical protein SK3146_01788 [Paenibacillus konkukensis]
MFELQDVLIHELLPYLFSIGIICSFSYVYRIFLHDGVHLDWIRNEHPSMPPLPRPRLRQTRRDVHHGLTRRVKRKEAPDGESGDCRPSLESYFLSKRGGCLWQRRTMDSPGLKLSAY